MTHEVRTRRGSVRGRIEGPVVSYRGIPFAEAPVGALRFAAPVPRKAWSGVLDATKRAPAAPHVPSDVGALIGLSDDHQSEDCLHATVWAPRAARRGSRLPVMVWIHGGGFEAGSSGNPLADGAKLAARGELVVVSLQYRIGIVGFVPLEGAADNRGLLDVVLGLQWVRDEIEAFGGDPERVTLFGSSAGGACVAALLALPEARACFHRAIVQSGTAECFVPRSVAEDTTREIATELGLSDAPGASVRRALEELRAPELVDVQRRVSLRIEERTGALAFAPWLPGEPFATAPLATVARGGAEGIPLLVGSNQDEIKLLALKTFPFMPKPLRRTQLFAAATRLFGGDERLAARGIALYEGAPELLGPRTNAILDALTTDMHFRVPAIRLADAHARHEERTYAYVFAFPSPQFGAVMGTPHAMEIPFVFGSHGSGPMPFFLGTKPILDEVSRRMQDVWIAFARTGDPSTSDTGAWPRHMATERATMILGDRFVVEPDLHRERMPFWRDVFARLRPVPGVDNNDGRSTSPPRWSHASSLPPAMAEA